MEKIIIYQTLPRLFGNSNAHNYPGGTLAENGSGKMSDFSDRALQSIRALGCNHIWYTGMIQHATKTDYSAYGIPKGNPYVIKGEAGSPYAITDYYDVDPDLADHPEERMAEFDALVKRSHQHDLKVILDFVPNHVARQYHSTVKPAGVKDFGEQDDTRVAFSPQNNFYYSVGEGFAPHFDLGSGAAQYREFPAKATGNDCFHPYPGINDWYETVKLNYGVDYSNGSKHFDPIPDTWQKMLDILLYWAAKNVDGFRCDMAHMVPIEFWEWVIPQVKYNYPDVIFIAEIYSPELYREYIFRGHFDYLYDKVGLYDTLRAITRGEAPASAITAQWQSLEGIQQHMVNFLENHDEQRIASDFFAGNAYNALPALIVSAMMNTNPFMLYFGQELGERGMDAEGFSGKDGRTTIFDYFSLQSMRDWNNNGKWDEEHLSETEKSIRRHYKQILTACNREEAIYEGAFFDLMYVNYNHEGFDPSKQYAFLRKYVNELLVVVVNFGDQPVNTSVYIPKHAFDYLNIPEGNFRMKELISGESDVCRLSADFPFTTRVEGKSGVVWKMEL